MAVPVSWLDLSFNYFSRIDESAESAHVLQYMKHLNVSANRLESVDFSTLEVPQLEFLVKATLLRISATTNCNFSWIAQLPFVF